MRIIIIVAFYLFLLTTPAFAQNVGSSRLSPDNPLYFLKAIRESLEIQFAGTEKVRVLKRLEFAQRRLREVNSLAASHREDLVAPNIEKFLLEINLVRPVKDVSMNPTVSNSLGHYMEVLVAIHDSLTDPRAKLAIRSAIYRLMDFNYTYYTNMQPIVANKIFPPQESKFKRGCDLLTKEASSSALNESERQILKERGEKCRLNQLRNLFK